jgi:hypothetical protein
MSKYSFDVSMFRRFDIILTFQYNSDIISIFQHFKVILIFCLHTCITKVACQNSIDYCRNVETSTICRNVETSKRRNYVETSKLRRNVETSKLRRNVEITSKRRNYEFKNFAWIFELLIWILFREVFHSILEENLPDFFVFSKFISRIMSFDFGRKFIRFFRIFKFYFANYLFVIFCIQLLFALTKIRIINKTYKIKFSDDLYTMIFSWLIFI